MPRSLTAAQQLSSARSPCGDRKCSCRWSVDFSAVRKSPCTKLSTPDSGLEEKTIKRSTHTVTDTNNRKTEFPVTRLDSSGWCQL